MDENDVMLFADACHPTYHRFVASPLSRPPRHFAAQNAAPPQEGNFENFAAQNHHSPPVERAGGGFIQKGNMIKVVQQVYCRTQ
jgi:hypothetical protein